MLAEDLDIAAGKMSGPAGRVIEIALFESRRRGHLDVTGGHLFLGFVQIEWDMFAEVLGEFGVNPHEIVNEIESSLRQVPSFPAAEVRLPRSVRLICRLALHRASRAGRHALEPIDLLFAMLEETHGLPATTIQQHDIDPAVLVSRLDERIRQLDARDERHAKRLELPTYLKQLATNLNLLARRDRLAPVFGRDSEIQQVLEILSHRDRSNSVMLLGEAGVGKTAIVEELARRLELEPDSIPLRLRDNQIVSLQMNALVAGTMLRGMFEERLQHVIRELKEHPNLILFIDEAHTMIGAGSALGAPSDAANILKSVLARGEIKVVGATTLGEYKEHVLEDEALARRFRCVHVAEPTIEETRRILYRIRPRLERNYSVRISDDAIDAALDLSPRYMRHLHLPDKVIGWLDTAAVRTEMDQRWEVMTEDVAAVVSDGAQIPKDMVFRDVSDRFHNLEAQIRRRVVGQGDGVAAVTRRLVMNKGPLKDGFDRPDGVLLFVGPTGVGKTELAKALAAALFGDEKKMIRIDMSEYQDGAVAVDKLIGMPRGIAGSQRGGILTNQLRDNPYTVLLLDEVEKASSNVLNLFLQAFDEGWLTDGRGRRVYLSDAIVIMTSNVGSEHFRKLRNPLGFLSAGSTASQVQSDIRRDIERRFAPEFLNRVDEVVFFSPLTHDEALQIAAQYLARISAAMTKAGKGLAVGEDALDLLVSEGYSPAFGARFLKRLIDERVKVPISAAWQQGSHFRVCVRDGKVVAEPAGIGVSLVETAGALQYEGVA